MSYYHLQARPYHPIDLDDIRSKRPHTIVLHNYYENRYYERLRPNVTFEDLVDITNELESTLLVITGSSKNHIPQWVPNHPHGSTIPRPPYTISRYSRVQIRFWETYNFTMQFFKWRENSVTNDAFREESIADWNLKFDNLFLSLNNVVKDHRIAQIDTLAKYEILHLGKFSWNSWAYDGKRDIAHSHTFQWKYWDPTIVVLDNFFRNGPEGSIHPDGTVPPNDLRNSFMQIVTETMTSEIYFTEKVATPMHFGKLFLVNGALGYHRALEEMGFVLYDEIFNYDFDSEKNMQVRVDMLTHNLFRLRRKTPEELKMLFESVLPKIKHNKQRLYAVFLDYSRIPHLYQELYKEIPNEEWASMTAAVFYHKTDGYNFG
ncbi:MAG: hypothetical protein EBU90_07015 [Proteobacteria bacterium]|nr:hypothetical protein [Pseudomonadota bacterium]NBP14164.1 hypothetical protein [bacterium]